MKILYYNFIKFLLLFLLILILVFIFRTLNESPIYNEKLKILYEDDYIIVIDKPSDIAVHGALKYKGPTIVDTLNANGYKLYKNGVVHRLDVGTSGVMVLAKNEDAYNSLKYQFKNHTVKKIYNALVQGKLEEPDGTINLPIGIINKEDNIYAVVENGKPSITNYKTIKVFNGLGILSNVSLLEVQIETGRTHQIRVHFSHMNHPLIGDTKYGSDTIFDEVIGVKHQWLNAKYLEFNHPLTGEKIFFYSDYPKDLKNSISLLSQNNI